METGERPRRRWWLIAGVGVTATLVVLHFTGTLSSVEQDIAGRLPERPADALLGIVNVFKCCILSWKALTTLLPAFLLAGAIAAFVPTSVIIKHLGAGANQFKAYGVAAFSGFVLSICSCNVVPLFASIYRRGAGIGPAFTFLYAGPAINIVALIFTIQVIGPQLGIWRAMGVPIVAVLAGISMALLFGRSDARVSEAARAKAALPEGFERSPGPVIALMVLLLGMVSFGAWEMPWTPKILGMVVIIGLVAWLMWARFSGEETKEWMLESWALVKLTLPLLVPAVLVIGAVAAYIDVKLVYRLVGPAAEGSGLWGALKPILLANTFGSCMYFPILTEVAFTKAFLKLGMGIGPALAILLTGAGTSIPADLIVWRAVGLKKVVAYEVIVLLLTTAYVLFFDSTAGQYICACMTGD